MEGFSMREEFFMLGNGRNKPFESGYSTFCDWFDAKFDDERCQRLSDYGFESGAVGLVYDSQTDPLYKEFANEIWHIVFEGRSMQEVLEGRDFLSASDFANFMVREACCRLAVRG